MNIKSSDALLRLQHPARQFILRLQVYRGKSILHNMSESLHTRYAGTLSSINPPGTICYMVWYVISNYSKLG